MKISEQVNNGKKLEDLIESQAHTNELLTLLLEEKRSQNENDKCFRDDWAIIKRYEKYITYVMLFIAVMALSFDVVQLEDGFIILDRIKDLFV